MTCGVVKAGSKIMHSGTGLDIGSLQDLDADLAKGGLFAIEVDNLAQLCNSFPRKICPRSISLDLVPTLAASLAVFRVAFLDQSSFVARL